MRQSETSQLDSGTEVVRTATAFDCGGKCPLRVHVRDGMIVRIEGDDAPEPQQLRACLRCRAYRQLVHHPDRLKFPMRRTGARGEGKFERISWDEALDTVAEELIRVKKTYGNSAILFIGGSGSQGALHQGGPSVARLLNMFGGYSAEYGNVSAEGTVFAVRVQYGDFNAGNSREDLVNSRLIIMWGWDPAKMIFGTNTTFHLARAKEAGAKIIAVDPIYHDTAATFADQWIPIRPGTDAAMIAAMAYVMIKENLHDQTFLDKYTVGFDRYKDYVLGVEDGVAKTPGWAEAVTGVPSTTVEKLAKEYASTRPAAILEGLGPGRAAAGEQFSRSTMSMAAITGNIGISGGSAGGGWRLPVGELFRSPSIPAPKNPVEAGAPSVRGSLDLSRRLALRVHVSKVWDAILKGTAGGYPFDAKLAYICGANPLNQRANSNKGTEALKKLEFVVVPELFMTATAKFADVLLPVSSHVERNDLCRPWTSGPYYIFANKAIDALYECKSDFEIACELAPRLGIYDYNDKTEDQWLREFVTKAPDMATEIPDYDGFKNESVHRVSISEPIVAFSKQIKDFENNPFPTPSGRIEIYSQRLADLNNRLLPPIPKYVETWEGLSDPLAKTYPLQLITPHAKTRVHSQMGNLPWLMEIERQSAWLNAADAETRGIADGDEVMVFNDRGKMIITAKVTERIMPGVVSITEGASYDPDEGGRDRGGCANVLTRDAFSPAGAFPINTALVQIEKL